MHVSPWKQDAKALLAKAKAGPTYSSYVYSRTPAKGELLGAETISSLDTLNVFHLFILG